MRNFLAIVIVFFLVSSCTSTRYGRYPKAKRLNHTKSVRKPISKKVFASEVTKYKIQSLPVELDNTIGLVNPSNPLEHNVQSVAKAKPKGDDKPRDVTPTNKNAKRAFISSIIALGSLTAGIFIAPFFLLLMIAFAAIAFVYSIIALKQIKRTGEYGRTKAEFALYSSIPILVLSIFGLLAYLMSNGTGIQIGSFILR